MQGAQLRLRAYHANRSGRSAGPLVIVLPGFNRTVQSLAAWVDAVSRVFETVLLEQPGQGGSETPATAGLETLVTELRAAVANVTALPVILVGEALGGLVALAIAADPPANLLAVMAVDPPLTPASQPHLVAASRIVLNERPNDTYLAAISRSVLGIGPRGEHAAPRAHVPLVMAAKAPTLLVTGDIDLADPRATGVFARTIDNAELQHLQAAAPKNVTVRVIPGAGHAVLSDQPAAALDLLRTFVAPATMPVAPL